MKAIRITIYTFIFCLLLSESSYALSPSSGMVNQESSRTGHSSSDLSTKAEEPKDKVQETILGTPTYLSVPKKDIRGKIVAMRENYNVKIEHGKVLDRTRLEKTAEDINWVLKNGGTPVIWGHNGRKTKGDLIDFDSTDGKIVLAELAKILQEKYGEELHYCDGVITEKGIDPQMAVFIKGKANVLNNIRVHDDFAKDSFAEYFCRIFAGKDISTFMCGAFGDIASKGPSMHQTFLKLFKQVVWAPSIVPELKDMEDIKEIKLIHFAGNKLDKSETLTKLFETMNLGGTIILGSAVTAFLKYDARGKMFFDEEISKLENVNILYPGDKASPDCYNIAIPDVELLPITVDGAQTQGYADISEESCKWFIEEFINKLEPGERVLFNGIVSWREQGYIDTTKRIVESIAEKVKNGTSIYLIGGDGPANFREFSKEILRDLPGKLYSERIKTFSGGGVPLHYVAIGLKKLVIANAMMMRNKELVNERGANLDLTTSL